MSDLSRFVASRCNCGGYFSGNHKDGCASFVAADPSVRRLVAWWLCWPTRRYWLWRAERVHARFLTWLAPSVGADPEPTPQSPNRGRNGV